VGNGEYTRFLQDKWCSKIPLTSQFPGLFAIAKDPEDVVRITTAEPSGDLNSIPKYQEHCKRNMTGY